MLNVKMIMSAVLLMVSLPFVSNAKDYETEISIKGNLITPPPCHIDDGKDIEVDFETISVKSI
ncbi:hypothetical protein CGH97_25230, partial [Vibrio parahaemolyticus]